MSDPESDEATLRREVASLRQQLTDALAALDAVAQGEVDAVALEDGNPVLLRAAQEELRTSQTLLRAVFDGSLDALLLADDDGRYVDVNRAACQLFGRPREELLGSTAADLVTDASDPAARFSSLLEVGHMRGQFSLRRPDDTRVVEFSAVANVVPGLHLFALRDATDRITAADTLRRSEARFRAMIEKGQDGITLLSGDVRTLYQSPAVERLLGYSLDEAQTMSWHDFVDEEERPKLASALACLMEGPGATTSLEFQIRTRDGSTCWLELTATNRLDDPDIGAIVTNFRDITERKRLEEEREGFFLLSIDLLCVGGTDGYFRQLNPAWEKTLGWSLEELCARPWLDFVHPADHQATEREGMRLGEGRVVVQFENRYRCKDGSYRWLKWAAIPASDGRIYACAHDVTSARVAARRDRLLFRENPVPMLLVDAATLGFLEVNDAAVERYGHEPEAFLATTLHELVVDGQEDLEAGLRGLLETRTTFAEHRFRTKSGEVLDVHVTWRRMDVGDRDAILGVVMDVTAAKRFERERARHIEQLRLLELSVSRLNDIVIITDAEPLSEPGPRIVFVNEAFEHITGYSREEAIGKTPRMLQGPQTDPTTLARLRAALERAEPTREELINYSKTGAPYWIEIDVSPVRDEAGKLTHFVAIERDITERHRAREALRQSDERLRQAQKMEAIGNLAGGIAHDFNNLLTVILSHTSLIVEDLPVADPLRAEIMEVHQAGVRATGLTRQLLAFSRKQVLEPQVVDVNVVLRDVEKMLVRVLGEDIELALHTSAEVGKVFVDPSQLEQVIVNLIVNARDAMPDGGNITIETSNIRLDDVYATAHGGAAAGSYVLLTVSDTGIGMDRATRERIFEPFFTTKEPGKGTGLGLSTVYGIVQQSGGHIWAYSEPGYGTTFKIYLPRTDRVRESMVPRSQDDPVLGGTETVLVVEDEAPVRRIVRNILRKAGYHVLEAQNGGEAFLLCEKFRGTIHLLLTDVVMPHMSGRELAERLVELRPQMKVLYMSGYTEDTTVHHGVLNAGVQFLPKPLLPEALLKKVRAVLDRRPRSDELAR